MVKKDKAKIDELLSRNVEEVVDKEHLCKALLSGKQLRVKLGIDPTGSKIHIGRAVILWKLREFQDLGHKIVLIVGDFTALVGDPSDKTGKRPMLSRKEVKENLKNYLPQIGKIIDLKKTEVRYNSEWLGKLDFNEIAELADNFSVQQMIERRNFKTRWDKHEEISLREFMYPLMQGYDSVAVKSDVELGGTDQLFNLHAGRKIQPRYGQKPQDILTVGMLIGTDGRKMSTSWGNVINIIDSADEQFGKLMSAHDDLIMDYFYFATRLTMAEVKKYEQELTKGKNPKAVKMELAKAVVSLYHGAAAAKKAAEKWESKNKLKRLDGELWVKFVSPATPTSGAAPTLVSLDLPSLSIESDMRLDAFIVGSGTVHTKSSAQRLIREGSISRNGIKVKNPFATTDFLKNGDILKIGKRHFFKIKKRD